MPEEITSCYICSQCAMDNGGSWPEVHVASSFISTCSGCGTVARLTEINDWDNVSIILQDGTHCQSSRMRREL